MTHDERYDAHDDLGGRIPESVPIESKVALFQMGLGSKAMRLEAKHHLQQQEDLKQRAINKAGADLVRQAGVVKPEEPQGIDTQAILEDWEEYARKHQEASRTTQTPEEN